MLSNALFSHFSGKYSKECIENAIESIGLDKNIRGERLSVENFINLGNALNN